MIYERLSLKNDSMIPSYADHIIRYQFAQPYCVGKRVLDAGCGVGYGARYLAANGAASVLGLDISEEALTEAKLEFSRQNLTFRHMDVENIGELNERFDVVVNFENLEHLKHPEKLVKGASIVCKEGTFITSTPNGAISNYEGNKLTNEFHVKEFTSQQLRDLLAPHFSDIVLFGQWLTHSGKLRQLRASELFHQLNDAYYNPINKLMRSVKRLAGKSVPGAPRFTSGADSYVGDYAIAPLNDDSFPWEPAVLIAICTQQ